MVHGKECPQARQFVLVCGRRWGKEERDCMPNPNERFCQLAVWHEDVNDRRVDVTDTEFMVLTLLEWMRFGVPKLTTH